MDLHHLRQERQKWLTWKNILPLQEAIASLPQLDVLKIGLGDIVEIDFVDITAEQEREILDAAKLMKPWRKGPFRISETVIDSEWQSFIKYNLLEPHFDLNDKIVGDIGCNNAYYLFRMQEQHPKKLVGFDPSAVTYSQFQFIDHFMQSDIVYELLGIEHVEFYEHRFDLLFCLGVLYHRSDPIAMLKSLYRGLNKGGELILDTFMIDGEEEICLTPKDRYSKIPNIYFVPTINALKNWCMRAGFVSVEILAMKKTELNEQRKTEWIDSQSLNDFLDPNDNSLTIEGYPAPKRVYIKAIKKSF
ncbi:MAG: tRNA 5-methoxyuridine(34)/uridine 5-oxyacetic acid(34) synthase CmoB [Epsilonproteobacteria bacterium]|nr:MAG: tRNA 5-methoxyuridine(34)/uridine 5-oxyacetic acid(34) synthase CmoB [Campylobacterota bacterium]